MYDRYNYLTEYQTDTEKLLEQELESLLKMNKVRYLYKTVTIKSGDLTEAEIFPSFYTKKDAPKEQTEKSIKKQKDANERAARKYFTRVISENFGNKDMWGTFGYDNNNLPETIEKAQDDMRKFIKKINYRCKKRGLANLKYVFVTEFDLENTRIHHHIIMSGDMLEGNLITRDEIEALWKHGGRPQTRKLVKDDYELSGLANYIAKDPNGKKRWIQSKGLKKPRKSEAYHKFSKRKVEKMVKDHATIEKEMLKNYPGHKLLDYEIKCNKENGFFYLYVRMRIKETKDLKQEIKYLEELEKQNTMSSRRKRIKILHGLLDSKNKTKKEKRNENSRI